VRQGNAGCKRALIRKQEIEDIVMQLAQQQVTDFVESKGAGMLAQLIEQESSVGVADDKALRARIAADRKRMDELVECLTPALASTLEGSIITLKNRIDAGEAKLADLDRLRMSQEEARVFVSQVVASATTLADAMSAGSPTEQKAILRGLVKEIELDPRTGKGTAVMYGIPLAALPQKQKSSTARMLNCSSRPVAGAPSFAIKSEISTQNRPFEVRIRLRERIAA
jgi:hypothetical protein